MSLKLKKLTLSIVRCATRKLILENSVKETKTIDFMFISLILNNINRISI
jgi:hypothetical protein